MTAFVFKIQANMDPNHRDRIAFARLCSGKLTRGMKAKLVRTGKPITLSAPQFFFAQDRALADEAYAGDVVGIPNHGTLRIGDTLTEGEEHRLPRRAELRAGNPAPRQARRPDEGEEAEGGAAADGGGGRGAGVPPARRRAGDGRRGRPAAARRAESAARRRIRPRHRLRARRNSSWRAGLPADEPRRSTISCRRIIRAAPKTSTATSVFMARNQFILDYTRERAPGMTFTDIKDVKKAA